MDDDFKDVLAIFSDDPEKDDSADSSTAEATPPANEPAPAPQDAPAAPSFKKPAGGKVFQRPAQTGKFVRPSATASPAAPTISASERAAAAAPATPMRPQTPAASAPPTLAAPLSTAAPQKGNPLHSFLLIFLIFLAFLSILISASALAKVGGLRTEIKLLNESMKDVRISADRSWKIQCGIFSPVPNQRPQEYMIMYDEENGKLLKKETIIRPAE